MSNNGTKTDLRVIKTKRAVCNAVCILLSRKDINEITISEIAELACINRKTFYNYYGSVHDVLNEMAQEIANGLSSLLESMDAGELMRNPSVFFRELKKTSRFDHEILEALLKMQGNQALVRNLIGVLQKRLTETVRAMLKEDNSEQISIIMDFIISGMVYAFREWVRNDRPVPLEEFSEIISRLLADGLNAFAR